MPASMSWTEIHLMSNGGSIEILAHGSYSAQHLSKSSDVGHIYTNTVEDSVLHIIPNSGYKVSTILSSKDETRSNIATQLIYNKSGWLSIPNLNSHYNYNLQIWFEFVNVDIQINKPVAVLSSNIYIRDSKGFLIDVTDKFI